MERMAQGQALVLRLRLASITTRRAGGLDPLCGVFPVRAAQRPLRWQPKNPGAAMRPPRGRRFCSG